MMRARGNSVRGPRLLVNLAGGLSGPRGYAMEHALPAAADRRNSGLGAKLVEEIRRAVAEVVIGQDEVVERILITLFTGGHLLLQGVPGLAKTLLVNAVARAISL